MRFKDLTAIRYGNLVVQTRVQSNKKRIAWQCQCDCGNLTTTTGDKLVAGKTKSCGCLRVKIGMENGIKNGFQPKHGMTKSCAFKRWVTMIDRCSNKYRDSARYYDRSIKVCDEWLIFENFYFDMGEPPKGMSLDRVDNNQGYSKQNCRWTTAKIQANNREKTRFLNVAGEKISLMDWADSLELNKNQAQYFFSTLRTIKKNCQIVSLWSD